MDKAMGGKEPADPPYVLIAEDDNCLAELIAFVVEQAGATPLPACDGQQALELARSRVPSLVITDLMMPRLGGDGLIAALRREWGAGLPVILVSAAPLAQLMPVGANAILSKPFDLVDLEMLVEHYLGAYRTAGTELLPQAQRWGSLGLSA